MLWDKYFRCMDLTQRFTIAWAAQRVTHLDSVMRYEDSYALSQEFCEWTTCLNVYPNGIQDTTLIVPDFNKENRTNQSTQS